MSNDDFKKISDFAIERANFVMDKLTFGCYIKFNEQELALIQAVLRSSLQPVYFKNLLKSLEKNDKQVIRVELVLVDK